MYVWVVGGTTRWALSVSVGCTADKIVQLHHYTPDSFFKRRWASTWIFHSVISGPIRCSYTPTPYTHLSYLGHTHTHMHAHTDAHTLTHWETCTPLYFSAQHYFVFIYSSWNGLQILMKTHMTDPIDCPVHPAEVFLGWRLALDMLNKLTITYRL